MACQVLIDFIAMCNNPHLNSSLHQKELKQWRVNKIEHKDEFQVFSRKRHFYLKKQCSLVEKHLATSLSMNSEVHNQ